MTADDNAISTGELARSLTALRNDLGQWRVELSAQLATHVTMQLYTSDLANVHADQVRTDERLQHMEDERDKWRLAIFTAIVAPLVVALVVGAFALKGMK